ncbi:hypothetical protein JY81_02100 [Neisseria meningitidis]|nr:hypothetical protein JY81_02100 [Neisseria meningitidis]
MFPPFYGLADVQPASVHKSSCSGGWSADCLSEKWQAAREVVFLSVFLCLYQVAQAVAKAVKLCLMPCLKPFVLES